MTPVLIFVLAAASPAAATGAPGAVSAPELAPAPFRVAPPGTTLVWSRIDGRAMDRARIGRVEGKLVHFTWAGEPRRTYLFCMRCASPEVRFDVTAYEALFPLHVGRSVEFDRSIEQWRWTNRITVVGTERLHLAFGVVDTYVIDSSTRGLNNPFHAHNRIWYAPSVGWNVRFEYRDSRGVSYAWRVIKVIPP